MSDFLFTATPNADAIRFIKEKPVVSREVFDGLLPELKARAFAVTGLESPSILKKLRDRIADLPAGAAWADVKGDIAARLSPFVTTADDPTAATRRATMLLRMHAFQSYAVAQERVAQRQKDVFPFAQYADADDPRVRPAHAALDGIVLPVDSEFWRDHTGPWEWGCRCRKIFLSSDDVADLEHEDAKKIPEARRVITGARRDKLEKEGTFLTAENGVPRSIDVRSPRAKFGGSAYSFDPTSIDLDLPTLKERYTPEVWEKFETWAKATPIPDQKRTVWEWLEKKPGTAPRIAPPKIAPVKPAPIAKVPRVAKPALPAPVPTVPPPAPVAPAVVPRLEESLVRLGLDGAKTATPADMAALLTELKEEAPIHIREVTRAIRSRDVGATSAANLTKWTQEFLDFIPPEVARGLPKLEIIAAPLRNNGEYFRGGTLKLATHLDSEAQARRVLFHELGHWLHRELPGDHPWVKAIAAHFEARTAGETFERLPGYAAGGKRDEWYEAYAGRIYRYAEEETHLGLEVPTRYLELLTLPAATLATMWNDPKVRETLLIVLRGLYP